jgi:DNA-binding protein H-NS
MDDLQKIQTEIAQLQKQAEHLMAKRKAEAIETIRALIKANGLTLKDLGITEKDSTRVGVPVPVKYRWNDQTWTGRGRQPKWVDDFLAGGGTLESICVK